MVFQIAHRNNRRATKRLAFSSYAPALEALESRNLLSAAPVQAGSWTTLANNIPDPDGAQVMLLLSDGTVMTRGGGPNASKLWYQLKPDSTGSYVDGAWSSLASMGLERLFFSSDVLPSGKVFVVGGEYSGPAGDQNFTKTGEIYDPVSNSWSSIANFPNQIFGDDPTTVLPDGRILAGYIAGPQSFIYDPAANIWTQTGTKLRNDQSNEESWVKLPDGSILSYDVFSSSATGVGHAQRYIPLQGTWVDAGTLPFVLSTDALGSELGPAFLLPDGRALFFGANGNTAYYTPSTNTWAAGPVVPNGLGCTDDPGAMLPNGHVLIAVSPQGTPDANGNLQFPPPTTIFEFDPVANTYLDVTPANFDVSQQNAFQDMMLVLPSGQIMLSNNSKQLAVYTPVGSPQDAWRPTISSVVTNGSTFTLTGTQLNGISEGAAYGDDAEMATNYPLVRLTDSSGSSFYVRTFNWSSTGVATGNTPVTVQFNLPAGHLPGIYGVTVIANGIASQKVQEDLGGLQIADVTKLEGNSGLTDFVFTVSQGASNSNVTVEYSTSDGTATVAGNDYVAQSGTLTFAPGQTAQQITIHVVGDKTVESDETFFVTLSNPTNSVIVHGQAVGTILNDDISLVVSNPTVKEGDVGTSDSVFNVTVIGVSHVATTINYTTSDGTANAGSDYLPTAGTLTISAGATPSFNVTVPIVGDLLFEPTENFFLVFTDSTNALISGGVGVCTILDNDVAPSLYVSDVQVTNTASGAQAVFTVALVGPSPGGITVQYATADGSAKANVNYVPVAGTVDFPLGSIKQLVTVPILGSAVYAPNETFYLNLFNPEHALLVDSQGVGTIVFAPPPPTETIIDDGEEGFTESLAGWSAATNLAAYHSDYMVHAPGNGTGTATWTFNNVAPGSYQIFAHWVAFSTFASNAPYTVFDGSTSLGTVRVNQQLAPAGDSSEGVVWQSLGTFNSSNRTLKVQLSDNANGNLIADAVRIVAGGVGPPTPEMDVSSFDTSIGDGAAAAQLANGTDFGSMPATTTSATHTFTIANTGSGDLHLSGSPRVTVSGAAAQDFTLITQPDATVAPGRTTTFQILFHPTAVGLRQASISISDDDPNESNYTFAVAGTGVDPAPNQLIIDDSTSGFSQTGSWTNTTSALAMQGEFLSAPAGQGNTSASWTFTALPAGRYHVYTTWVPSGDRASNSPFTVSDGGALAQTFLVNQQQAPSDGTAAGMTWRSLTSIQITTGMLLVSLNNQANGSVQADAVLISRTDLPAPPAAAPPAGHNAAMPLDVNGDQIISPLDALAVINKLISQSAGNSATTSAMPLAATFSTQYFLDVNDDTIVSPLDALIVINYLNQSQATASPSANSLATSAVTSASANPPAALSTVAVDQAISQISAVPQATNGSATSTSSNSTASSSTSMTLATVSVTQSSSPAMQLSPANVRAAFFASSSKKGLGDSESDSLLG